MTHVEINHAVAGRARAGDVLTDADLAELDALDVLLLGMLADEVRRARVGAEVTYARVFEPAAEIDLERLTALAAAGVEIRLGAPEASLTETVSRVARVREAIGPHARLVGFSLADLVAPGWAPLADVLGAVRTAGLDAIAEAPIDVLTSADVEAVGTAGLRLGALSVQRMPARRVALVLQARAFRAGRPWIDAFAPLSREQSVSAPTTGYHDVRMVALARLGLPEVSVIQVDWQQYGPKLAQVALAFGASHLDGVSPFDDPALGPRRGSVEDVRRHIAAAGFTAAERGGSR